MCVAVGVQRTEAAVYYIQLFIQYTKYNSTLVESALHGTISIESFSIFKTFLINKIVLKTPKYVLFVQSSVLLVKHPTESRFYFHNYLAN